MSESILKALMQLFAIIANASTDEAKESGQVQRSTVRIFLLLQISSQQVEHYMQLYEAYYQEQLERTRTRKQKQRYSTSSSVRVLKICSQINEELYLSQKFIVMARLVEFTRVSGGRIEDQELDFIQTVAESFHISQEELDLLIGFVQHEAYVDASALGETLRIVDEEQPAEAGMRMARVKHLGGEICVLQVRRANLFMLRYFGEKGVFVGGQPISPSTLYILGRGSSIRIASSGTIFYTDIVRHFAADGQESQVQFAVRNVGFTFPGGQEGLRSVSFEHHSGQLVGIMGSSGAGKSTLLNVLNGSAKPTRGQVLINGVDIYQHARRMEGVMGFVSQDDLLIEELTVFQNLYYSAELSLAQLAPAERNERILQTLENLGLLGVKDLPVGSPLEKRISGGQRKRLNIALELIREPAILFLDEPTSGLSSRDSENLMGLLKELSLGGKLLYVVIHQPSSSIYKMFDGVVLLDTGGYLIYQGDPVAAIGYFRSRSQYIGVSDTECSECGNVNPEQLFDIVENPVVDEYGKVTSQRRVQPEEWAHRYGEWSHHNRLSSADAGSHPLPVESIPRSTHLPGWARQLGVFFTRDTLAKLANRQYLLVNILEAPLLAAMLAFLIRYYDVGGLVGRYHLMGNGNLPVYLFMAVIVAFFVGISGSAESIVKDRKIRKRERFLNLSWGAYLSGKMLFVVLVSIYQSFVFTLIGNAIMGVEGMLLHYWLVLFCTWVSAATLGLVISDSFKTVVTIYILIPFLVIPQIILSGIIVRFDRLNPSVASPAEIPAYGELVVSRWAYEALAVQQYRANPFQRHLYEYEQTMSLADYKKSYWIKELNLRLEKVLKMDDTAEAVRSWRVICHELRQDQDPVLGSGLRLQCGTLDESLLPTGEVKRCIDEHIHRVESYYVQLYNAANRLRDSTINALSMQAQAEGRSFQELKQGHYNLALAALAREADAPNRIVEYGGKLIRHYDPIYQLPESPFIKAHFYSPYKRIGRLYLDTYWVNVGVLLFSILALYAALYFRLLPRMMQFLSKPFWR